MHSSISFYYTVTVNTLKLIIELKGTKVEQNTEPKQFEIHSKVFMYTFTFYYLKILIQLDIQSISIFNLTNHNYNIISLN